MYVVKEIADIKANYGLTIIDTCNNIIGFHTGNSRTIDGIKQIKIITGYKKIWISGKAIKIDGMGIKFVEDYTLDNPIDTIKPCGTSYY